MSRRLVEFDYLLKNAKGEVLDSSKEGGGEPMRYVEGSNQIIPGLESRMKTLKKGDKKEITVPAVEAYGTREDKLVIEVPLDQFPANQKVTVGLEVEIEISQNYFHPFTVTQVNKSHATLDGNHELAGEDLFFSVEVKEAREATKEEIAESETVHEHVHGENCNHSH
ncbi:MAG: peptidylprolyl isomerase [Proteobacteria bacterium]|nr:peptidylprolyl isomerase [Pseudomonadota bacterium]